MTGRKNPSMGTCIEHHMEYGSSETFSSFFFSPSLVKGFKIYQEKILSSQNVKQEKYKKKKKKVKGVVLSKDGHFCH